MNNVVVIAPHPDDAELGVGGTILKHIEFGDKVDVILLCTNDFRNLPDEDISRQQNDHSLNDALRAKSILGYNELHFCGLSDETLDNQVSNILDVVEPITNIICPDILYVTHFADNNQDHRAAYQAAQVIARPSAPHPVKAFICYETPSGTDQTPQSSSSVFCPNLYNSLSKKQLDNKIKAFKEYKSEVREAPHPRSEYGILNYAKFRGMQAGVEYAEALCVMRALH